MSQRYVMHVHQPSTRMLERGLLRGRGFGSLEFPKSRFQEMGINRLEGPVGQIVSVAMQAPR